MRCYTVIGPMLLAGISTSGNRDPLTRHRLVVSGIGPVRSSTNPRVVTEADATRENGSVVLVRPTNYWQVLVHVFTRNLPGDRDSEWGQTAESLELLCGETFRTKAGEGSFLWHSALVLLGPDQGLYAIDQFGNDCAVRCVVANGEAKLRRTRDYSVIQKRSSREGREIAPPIDTRSAFEEWLMEQQELPKRMAS